MSISARSTGGPMIIRLEESIKAEDEVVVASGMRGIEPVDSEAFVEE